MSEILVIVDSAAKGTIIEEYFAGRAETVICQNPPMQPVYKRGAKDSTVINFTYKELPAGQDVIPRINKFLDKDIYIALDGDSRSEYCVWLLNAYIQGAAKSRILVKRLVLHGLSKEKIGEALKLVTAVDEEKGIKFYIRALFDIYLGRHLQRLIGTNKGPANLPLNFNSLATVFSLGDREAEIKMFAPPEKWQVIADLRLDGQVFTARLEGAADLTTDGFFKEIDEAEKAVALVREDKFIVDTVERSDLRVSPPAPYKMAELLHDAFVLCGIGLKDTSEVVCRLFNGVEKDGKTMGLLSSFYDIGIAGEFDDWQADLRKQVVRMNGEDALGDGLAESASAGLIYPLYPEMSGSDLSAVLNPKEVEIYDLVRNRALASQMRPAIGENLKVEITAGPESLFICKFHHVTQRGFMDIYQGGMDKKFTEPCPLAAISEGDETVMLRVSPEKTVNVPAAYTVETLFADLEEFSIAIEPINILMLQRMIDTGYIKVSSDGYWRTDEKNIQVEMILKRAFPRMQGVHLSAYIEQTITEVTSGRKGIDFALKQFDQTLMGHGKSLVKAKVAVAPKLRGRKRTSSSIIKQVDEKVVESTPVVSESTEEVITPVADLASVPESVAESSVESEEIVIEPDKAENEPDAGADGGDIAGQEETIAEVVDGEEEKMAEEAVVTADIAVETDSEPTPETGQDGWSGELKNVFEQTMAKVKESGGEELPAFGADTGTEEIVATEQSKVCQVCGKSMLLKKDRFGKFWSCSGFPKCRHSEAYVEEGALNMLCPLCGDGKIIQKRTPTGKTMYVCPEADCEFMAWARPYNIPCQICDSTYLVEKKSSGGSKKLCCPRAGCNYKLLLPGGEESQDAPPEPKKKKKVRVRRVAKGSGSGKKVRVVRRRK